MVSKAIEESWSDKQLGEILTLNYGWSLPEKNRVAGDFPVFGSNGVVGSHNKALVSSCGIIVGRKGSAGNVHFSRKPFCPIDTTFFVTPSDTHLDIEFLYFLLLHLDLKRILGDVAVPGLNREMAYRERAQFPNEISEQRKIARMLRLVQRAMEQQERLLALTAELKEALLHQLFTHSLHHEPQEETEIGLVPHSWPVMRLGELISEDPKNGLYKHSSEYGDGARILRIDDFSNDGDIVHSALNRVQVDDNERSSYALRKDDIVFNRVNSLSHLGKTALVGELIEPMIFESNMMRFRVDDQRVLPSFVFRALNSPICKRQIIASAKRAVAQSSINQGDLRAILLPVPPLGIQEQILEAIETVVHKIEVARTRRRLLADLFHTLLNEVMTAKIWLHDRDLPELESTAATA